MNHYVIRLNVQPCEKQFMWRVWENGIEFERAFSNVRVNVPSYTETTLESEPDRFGRFERNNIACDGYAVYDESVLTINGSVAEPGLRQQS
jgi:hypothetical protein